MNHIHAIRQACTERYLLGEMSEPERHDFEEHFFDCRECADDVKTAVAFIDNAREVIEEQSQEIVVKAAAAAAGIAWLRHLRPAFAMAALALLCLAGWQALFVVPQLRHRLAEVEAPQAVRWEFLSVSRSNIPTLEVSSRHRLVGFRLSRSTDRSFPDYRCELRDGADRLLQSAVIPAPPEGEELGLVLPVSGLPAGAYVIVLSGLDSPHDPVVAPELARYRFVLKLEEEEHSP